MDVFDRFAKAEKRSLESPNISVPADNFLNILGYGDMTAASGVTVNVETVVRLPAICSAINFISGTLTSLPLRSCTNHRAARSVRRFIFIIGCAFIFYGVA